MHRSLKHILQSSYSPLSVRKCNKVTSRHLQQNRKLQQRKASLAEQTIDLPSHARVVVCGGGAVGASVAYHLAESGWTDVVVLEQGRLMCGSTWSNSGQVGQIKIDNSNAATRLVKHSCELYQSLQEQGHNVGWKKCGSINMARTKDRLTDLKRKHAIATALGIENVIISPSEITDICPWPKIDDLEGALWIPGDGVVTPTALVSVLSRLAMDKGVKFYERVEVEEVLLDNFRVNQVVTSHGTINCQFFVNCAGQWAREVGKLCDPRVAVPLQPCEHTHLLTKPIEGMDGMLPVIRDYDGLVCFREWNGGIMASGFEPVGKGTPVPISDHSEFEILAEDWDDFQPLLEQIIYRIPVLADAQIQQLRTVPEAFTPDGRWILGESAEVANYFVASGYNCSGVAGAGGIGKYMAEWIINKYPSVDMWPLDILRFVVHHNNKKFLRDRVKETVAMYTLKYPHELPTSGRNLRTSPLHTQLEVAGACFGATNAYERPMWYNPPSDEIGLEPGDETTFWKDDLTEDNLQKHTFGKPGWFEHVRDEYWACKERVSLIDMSSFTKIEIKSAGGEALRFLQYMCSNNIDDELGTVVHTGMQNYFGGYENDCSIVPLEDNLFFMIAPTSQQTRSLSWLRRHMPKDGSVQIRDVTSMYSGINMVGPHAEVLLSDLTETSVTKTEFKQMTCKVIDVGYASGIRAMRLTHAGEDGFVLYVPSEYSLHVYDVLMKAGQDYGIRNAGYYALRFLRIEKFFAYWGIDLSTHTTPLECGREFRVKFDKGDFLGKDALLRQKEEGVNKRFVQFLLEDFDVDLDFWPWGGEPIYRNGQFVGTVTTGAFGFTLNKMICLGFVRHKDDNDNLVMTRSINQFILDRGARYEIEIAGKRVPAKAGIYTPQAAYTTHSDLVFIPVPSSYG